ncbi:hypothetical protein CEA92_06665 [Bacillus velezensis]|nr:hypothetical protein CEA92_06665 [Bacillus velezensis]
MHPSKRPQAGVFSIIVKALLKLEIGCPVLLAAVGFVCRMYNYPSSCRIRRTHIKKAAETPPFFQTVRP